jgi:hypothetical protein
MNLAAPQDNIPHMEHDQTTHMVHRHPVERDVRRCQVVVLTGRCCVGEQVVMAQAHGLGPPGAARGEHQQHQVLGAADMPVLLGGTGRQLLDQRDSGSGQLPALTPGTQRGSVGPVGKNQGMAERLPGVRHLGRDVTIGGHRERYGDKAPQHASPEGHHELTVRGVLENHVVTGGQTEPAQPSEQPGRLIQQLSVRLPVQRPVGPDVAQLLGPPGRGHPVQGGVQRIDIERAQRRTQADRRRGLPPYAARSVLRDQ